MLPDLKGKRILEIGCGMGQHTKQHADLGAEQVIGIDISEKMLNIARNYFSDNKITYQKMALEDLNQVNDKFDIITSSLVF